MFVIIRRVNESIFSLKLSFSFTDQVRCLTNLEFVPKCEPVKSEDVELLQQFINSTGKICVMTGAGISTESGIPDYRSEGVGLYATSNRRPVLYQDFCKTEKVRKTYWARNYAAWPRFSSFKPNYTHKWLKNMEDIGKVNCVITQNVDNLHSKAGSKHVIELHGTSHRVICLRCDKKIDRFTFQDMLSTLNPNSEITCKAIRPDGDVDLSKEQIDDFKVPPCENCGGILKPDIVFFGDNVPRATLESIKIKLMEAHALLVLGTSLTTFSGYRIILQANKAMKPIAIINIGETRGDEHAQFKVHGRCAEILSMLTKINSKIF